eukprot:1505503-Amphidinium_carterae.1
MLSAPPTLWQSLGTGPVLKGPEPTPIMSEKRVNEVTRLNTRISKPWDQDPVASSGQTTRHQALHEFSRSYHSMARHKAS